jgi:hypothetical protein
MSPSNQSSIFETGQIPTDTGGRRAGNGEDFLDAGCTYTQQELDDLFAASVQGVGHDANDSTRSEAPQASCSMFSVNFSLNGSPFVHLRECFWTYRSTCSQAPEVFSWKSLFVESIGGEDSHSKGLVVERRGYRCIDKEGRDYYKVREQSFCRSPIRRFSAYNDQLCSKCSHV